MPQIIIHDFNPSEGDRIEISPSFAIYDGLLGFEIKDGGIAFKFAGDFSSSYQSTEFSDFHVGPPLPPSMGGINANDFAYRSPGDPSVPMMIQTDTVIGVGESVWSSSFTDLNNGNQVVVWVTSDPYTGNSLIYSRVIDPVKSEFVTEPILVGSGKNYRITGVEAYGDDSFYVNAEYYVTDFSSGIMPTQTTHRVSFTVDGETSYQSTEISIANFDTNILPGYITVNDTIHDLGVFDLSMEMHHTQRGVLRTMMQKLSTARAGMTKYRVEMLIKHSLHFLVRTSLMEQGASIR